MIEACTGSATPEDPLVTAPAPERTSQPLLRTAAWWLLTLLVLVILDDLTFGPIFWTLSRVAGTAVAVVAVFAIYVPAQIALVYRGTQEHPGRLATFFLRRLDVERRSGEIGRREQKIRSKIVGVGSAMALTLLLAGVLPCLLLWRRGYSRSFVLRLSVPTSALYAAEFALLHAVFPGSL